MILARVLGAVVATVQHPAYDDRTVLVVQPVLPDGLTPDGSSFLSVDAAQAGPGDLVLCAREGNTARQILGDDDDPLHSVVLAVVDELHHLGGTTRGPGWPTA